MKTTLREAIGTFSTAIAYALLILFSIVSVALSDSPQKIARALSEDRAEAVRIRARHNEALKNLFDLYGLPQGDAPSNIVARTKAIELLAASATNSANKSRIGAVLKDLRTRNPGVFSSDK